MEAGYGFTLELNGGVIFSDSTRQAPTFSEFARASMNFLRKENTATLRFSAVSDSRIEQYAVMMTFVRVEVSEYEADSFFISKEVKRREDDEICYSLKYIKMRLATADTN